MLELPHALIGAAIAVRVSNPLISIPLALLSHFLTDLIPHWNPSLYTETKNTGKPSRLSNKIVVIDTGLSLIGGLAIAGRFLPDITRSLTVIIACFFAVLPDLIEAPYFYLNFRPKIMKQWVLAQHKLQGRTGKIPGITIQIITILVALAVIFI